MHQSDDAEARALSRYWEALIQGAPEDELRLLAGSVEPWRIEMINNVRQLRSDFQPDPAFVAALDRNLAAGFTKRATQTGIGTTPFPTPNWLDRSISRFGPRPSLRHIVLATLVAILALFAIVQYTGDDDSSDPSILAPSGSPTASEPTPPVSGPASVTLIHAVIPQNRVNSGEEITTAFALVQVEPGSTGSTGSMCCDGIATVTLLSGDLHITSEGPAQILRAEGALDEPSAGTEFVLHAGDTWFSRNKYGFSSANPGDEVAELLWWVYLDDPGRSSGPRSVAGWSDNGMHEVKSWSATAVGDMEIIIRKVGLHSNEHLEIQVPGALRMTVRSKTGPDPKATPGSGSGGYITTTYVIDFAPAGDLEGLPIVGIETP